MPAHTSHPDLLDSSKSGGRALEFKVLGALDVVADGSTVVLGGRRQRVLLGLLIIRANEVVSTDQLIDALWGERPPRTARASLHNVVSELRSRLGAEVLERRWPGYVLRVEPDQVDALRFQQLFRGAMTEAPSERASTLEEALSLWHGTAFLDLLYEDCAQIEARRLEELRVAALEELAAARLASGVTAEVVADLRALVDRHPYRENLRRLLMLALHRSGRAAEAFGTDADWRETLGHEAGAEPGRSLGGIATAIAVDRLEPDEVLA